MTSQRQSRNLKLPIAFPLTFELRVLSEGEGGIRNVFSKNLISHPSDANTIAFVIFRKVFLGFHQAYNSTVYYFLELLTSQFGLRLSQHLFSIESRHYLVELKLVSGLSCLLRCSGQRLRICLNPSRIFLGVIFFAYHFFIVRSSVTIIDAKRSFLTTLECYMDRAVDEIYHTVKHLSPPMPLALSITYSIVAHFCP